MDTSKAILDLLSYFAVFKLALTHQEILSLIAVKSSYHAVGSSLAELIEQHKVQKIGNFYGLYGVSYPNPLDQKARSLKLLKKARRWSKLFAWLPFIKSIVVVNSVSFGNVNKKSDIDFLIVTKPNRIYITKGILRYTLKALSQLETVKKKARRFSLGMFLTTYGVNFKKDIMKTNQPHLPYWLIMAKPVYGASCWYGLIKSKAGLDKRFPNYPWPQVGLNVYSGGLYLLDIIDEIGYKKHLRHTASQPKNKTARAFIRLRPDIINLHAQDKSTQIAKKYYLLRSKF